MPSPQDNKNPPRDGNRGRGRDGRARGRGGRAGGPHDGRHPSTKPSTATAENQNQPENPDKNQRGRSRNGCKSGGSREKPKGDVSQQKEKPKEKPKPKARNALRSNATLNTDRGHQKPQLQNPTPPKKAIKRKPTLQTLPPELRWKIYNYLFEPVYRVEIQRLKHKTADHSIRTVKRLYHQRLRPRNPQTQSPFYYSYHSEKRGGKPLPLSLIFSCKIIYLETILHLYSTTQFVFNSTRALDRFLHTTSIQAKASIQHIELNHIMYNEPRLLQHRLFKHRSDLAFYLAVEDLAVTCKGLRVLHVNMRIWDWPIRLELGERWSWPLLTLERYGNRVDYASVRLQMGRFGEEVLEKAGREVERRIMVPERWRVREDERLARELNGGVKASRVLKVVF